MQKAIWIVENGEVKAISNTELDMKNYAIQPTQSFFVKEKESSRQEKFKPKDSKIIKASIATPRWPRDVRPTY